MAPVYINKLGRIQAINRGRWPGTLEPYASSSRGSPIVPRAAAAATVYGEPR